MALAKHWYGRLKGGEVVYNNEIKKTKGFLDDYPLNILEGKLLVCATPAPDKHLFNAYESHLDFIMATSNIDPIEKHFYEIIPGNWLQKPKFDLDFKISDGVFVTTKPDGSPIAYIPQQILEHLISAIIKVLEEVYITLNLETDILIYSSSLGEKQSYHLIVNNWYHKSNLEAQGFYSAVVSKIPTELNTGKLIDASVYSKTQQFRILGSTKVGAFRPKTLLDSFTYQGNLITHQYPILKDVPEEQKAKQLYIQKLEESLITQISACNALPDFVKPDATVKSSQAQHLDFEITPSIATFASGQLPSRGAYKISKIKEGLIILQRTRPSNCEICKRIHESENIFLRISSSGVIYLYCRRTTGSVAIGGLPIEFLNQIKEVNLQARLKMELENKINEGLTIYHNDPNLANYGVPILNNIEVPKEEKKIDWDPINISDLTALNIDVFQKPTIASINEACEKGHLDVLKTLCKKAKPTNNSISIACRKGNLEIIKYLHSLGIMPSNEDMTIICKNGDLEAIKYFSNLGIILTNEHMTIACKNGDLEIVKYIYSLGIIPMEENLEIVVDNNYLDIINFLIDIGVQGSTLILNSSAKNNNVDIFKVLIQQGCKPNGSTLNRAIEGKSVELIEYLLNLGIKGTIITLELGINTQNLELVKLLSSKIKPNKSSLIKAQQLGNVEIIEYLKELIK